MIAVQKSELENISLLNTIVTVCCSAASGILFMGLGFLWDATSDEQINRTELAWIIVSAIGFSAFLVIAILAYHKRKSTIDSFWYQDEPHQEQNV